MNGHQTAQHIVKNWALLDFLDQESFQKETIYHKAAKTGKDLRRKLDRNIFPSEFADQIFSADMEEIFRQAQAHQKQLKLKFHGPVHVYYGLLPKQEIIRSLGKADPSVKDQWKKIMEQPEEDTTSLWACYFQLTPEGMLVESSLQISPALWLLYKLKSTSYSLHTDHMKAYREDMNKLLAGMVRNRAENPEEPPKASPAFSDHRFTRESFQLLQKYVSAMADRSGIGANHLESSGLAKIRYAKYEKDAAKASDMEGLSTHFFVPDLIRVLKAMQDKAVPAHLESYILSFLPEARETVRTDLLAKDQKLTVWQEIFDPQKLPLGKWPSQYSPALMQQAAINLTITKHDEKRKDQPDIFSVNGPPGTGKTTLLKEIIANHITERAIVLSQYANPDSAFQEEDFTEGDQSNKGYKFMPHWYSWKDDRILDYSILVASCNNNAVENISKELPLKENLLSSLDKEDPAVQEIRSLFSEPRPEYRIRGAEDDIFFTRMACNVQQKYPKEERVDYDLQWGLVSAPMGKSSNTKVVYEKALTDFLCNYHVNAHLDTYTKQYQAVRKQFLNQLKVVQNMQKQLGDYARLSETQQLPSLTTLQQQAQQLDQQMKQKEAEISRMDADFRFWQEQASKRHGLFRKKDPTAQARYAELASRRIQLEKERDGLYDRRQKTVRTTNGVKQKMQERQQKRKDPAYQAWNQEAVKMDQAFLDQVLSEVVKASTEAHVKNPWRTDAFDREREKLFFLALQLTKFFMLSSKKFRTNMNILKNLSTLDAADRQKCQVTVFQSLFLLVPVMSATFASISSFLKDIDVQKAIGLLIVDEAGQAQPHMAAGALWRARKALIVGDPKQVAPVVTDDMKLMRTLLEQENTTQYLRDKELSVQHFADKINPYGTYLQEEGREEPQWVGCPLTVHRRCISPMFDISNAVSYDGIMKQQTRPPQKEREETFLCAESQWFHVTGKEMGSKNHYVPAQGEQIVQLLKEKGISGNPDLFIITPFTSVKNGLQNCLRKAEGLHLDSTWIYKNIGTVHTFQGKEAAEVFFVLGCDQTSTGAIQWVNSNIVNVAVSRAKYRLYVVGDANLAKANPSLKTALCHLPVQAREDIR